MNALKQITRGMSTARMAAMRNEITAIRNEITVDRIAAVWFCACAGIGGIAGAVFGARDARRLDPHRRGEAVFGAIMGGSTGIFLGMIAAPVVFLFAAGGVCALFASPIIHFASTGDHNE